MSDVIIETAEFNATVEDQMLVDAQGQHIILFEDCVAAVIGDNTSSIEKRITYEDFHAIISNILNRRNEESLEGFQLPSNCFFFAKSASTVQLSCYYAERVAEMKHLDSKYMVKTPNLIISHTLTKGSGKGWRSTGARFFCTDKKVSGLPKGLIWEYNPSQRVFISPFPNTYAEGTMCYGSNSMPTVFADSNLTGLNWYYQFLFESPFNNDLGIRGLDDSMPPTSWFKLLAKVAEKNEPFPYEKLRGYTKLA